VCAIARFLGLHPCPAPAHDQKSRQWRHCVSRASHMLTFDLRAFEARAKELGGQIDQLPFALANSLNQGAFNARRVLVENTWPTHVTVRNSRFMNAALQVEKATKRDLTVAVSDKLGRAHLALHAKGGTKRARGRLAIPTKAVTRGARGVPQSQRPANLKRAVVRGGLIFQAQGRGKNAKLRLMFKLQPSAQQPKDVPFFETWRDVMQREMRANFGPAMAKAMQSRRR
jgi:hypothetical protein